MALTIEEFSEFAQKKLLPSLPGSYLAICKPTSNPAANIDYESNTALGRFTYWQSGNAFCEVLQLQSDTNPFHRHYEIGSEAVLQTAFDDFRKQFLSMTD